jgi:hypothetical protein
MQKELIRQLVQDVLQEQGLMDRPASPSVAKRSKNRSSGPVVLTVFHPGVRKLEQALAQLKPIEQAAAKSSVYTVDSARSWVCGQDVKDQAGTRCILDTVKTDGLEKVLQRADILVLPTFCLKTGSKVARLAADDLESNIVLSALVQGKQVLATNDGFLLLDSLANPGIRSEMSQILAKLESFGMRMCKTEDLAATFQEMHSSPGPKAAPGISSNNPELKGNALMLITAKHIQAAANAKQESIVLAPGGLITPLARDQAKDYGIKIVMARNN